ETRSVGMRTVTRIFLFSGYFSPALFFCDATAVPGGGATGSRCVSLVASAIGFVCSLAVTAGSIFAAFSAVAGVGIRRSGFFATVEVGLGSAAPGFWLVTGAGFDVLGSSAVISRRRAKF